MKAYVQVYTGEGKGKTTAAIGLAIRAIGAGKKVLFLQFMKSKVYSEHTILPTLQNLTLETVGKPFFIIKEGMKSKDELAKWGDEVVVFESGNPPKDYVALIEKDTNAHGLLLAVESTISSFLMNTTWRSSLNSLHGIKQRLCSMLVIQKRNSYSQAVGLLKN